MLMSFIGCVGKLMSGSGLSILMGKACCVEKILLGGEFPMNLCALRFVAIEILRHIILDSPIVDVFNNKLNELSGKSILADHWIKNLIRAVFIMLMYLCAERESDFALHCLTCKLMLPYFFTASHWNYARDGTVYLRYLEKLYNTLLN